MTSAGGVPRLCEVYGQLNASTDFFRRDFDADPVKNFNGMWTTGWQASREGITGEKPFRTYRVAEGAQWMVDAFTPPEEKAKPYKKGTRLSNDVDAMALIQKRATLRGA